MVCIDAPLFSNKIRGNNKAISISKTRKITAKRKNRKENGDRALSLGSNPHSKEEFLLFLKVKRELISKASINKIVLKRMTVMAVVIIINMLQDFSS